MHSQSTAARVWDRVQKDGPLWQGTPCWLWLGRCNHDGYGVLYAERRNRRAHHVVYELIVGPLPEGLEADHLCRVRHCVNPRHLEWVTHTVNVQRGEAPSAQLGRQTACKNGHPFTPENTYARADGSRRCRLCKVAWGHDYYLRRKAA